MKQAFSIFVIALFVSYCSSVAVTLVATEAVAFTSAAGLMSFEVVNGFAVVAQFVTTATELLVQQHQEWHFCNLSTWPCKLSSDFRWSSCSWIRSIIGKPSHESEEHRTLWGTRFWWWVWWMIWSNQTWNAASMHTHEPKLKNESKINSSYK